ncbi:MAG: rhamnogalacturonan acetylesterase [Acidobacteriaceae bacterium]|nr:rhamnogalacturonan acetylesterase [Acidobacteriaceae bacterium]
MRQLAQSAIRLSLSVALALTCSLGATAQNSSDPDGTPHNAPLEKVTWHNPDAKVKLVLVGDSTVQDSSGWGPGFEALLRPDIECLNLAKGGRSSKSFRVEGRWAQALSLKPDYIILGFSHNDIHRDKPERYTTVDEFRANIKRFVDEAKAAGIKPILMTSLGIRRWDKEGHFEDTAALIPYEQATRDVAAEENIPLIDIVKLTTAFYISKGKAAIDTDSPLRNGKIDNSHLNHQGAMEIGALIAQETKTDVPALAPYIK